MKTLFLAMALALTATYANAESKMSENSPVYTIAAAYVYTCYAKAGSVQGKGYSASIKEAQRLAVADCKAKSGGQSCRIVKCF